MRTRFAVLVTILSALVIAAVPAIASAAPRRNHGLTINATPNPIIAGEGVLIYGQLNGANHASQTISLYHRVNPQAHFSLIGTTTTNSLGFFEFTRAEGIVLSNREWFVRGPAGKHSRTVHERVAALVSLAASSMAGDTNHPIVFTGQVTPSHPFQRVELQEQDSAKGNGWKTIATTFTGAASHFALSHRWARPGLYTLRALFPGDARNIAGASDTMTVTVQQAENPAFTINSSSPIITEGSSVKISGVLDQVGTQTAEPMTGVTLFGQTGNGSRKVLGTRTTHIDGSYSFTESPTDNEVYQVETTLRPERASAELFEGVQDVVTIKASSSTATAGGTVVITGTVDPDKTGHAIYLQRLGADGDWHNVTLGVVTTGSQYSFTYTFGQTGTVQLRARIDGGPDNVGAASSPVTVMVSGVAPVTSLPPAS